MVSPNIVVPCLQNENFKNIKVVKNYHSQNKNVKKLKTLKTRVFLRNNKQF